MRHPPGRHRGRGGGEATGPVRPPRVARGPQGSTRGGGGRGNFGLPSGWDGASHQLDPSVSLSVEHVPMRVSWLSLPPGSPTLYTSVGWIGRPSQAFPPLEPCVILSHHTAPIILRSTGTPRPPPRGPGRAPTPSRAGPRPFGLWDGLQAPQGGGPKGHRSRIYALSKSAPFRGRADAPIPAITARPSLFAGSSARWHMAPIARNLAQPTFPPLGALGPRGEGAGAVQPTGLPSSRCGTWGVSPRRALRSLLYPGEDCPNDTVKKPNRAPSKHRRGGRTRAPTALPHGA